MTNISLFSPLQLGELSLTNRVVMAPMTRSRAKPDGTPTPEMTDYYRQRAGAGLIISEGIQPSADGQGYCRSPGLHTPEQKTAWTEIASAVTDAGGQLVAQLMHVGRVASAHNKQNGARTLAPSALQAPGEMYTDTAGMQPHDTPEAMTHQDISQTISDYVSAAKMARRAGFEGIELHATSGYLPAQFLSTGTNKRSDAYGGTLAGRLKFVLELIGALSAAIGAGRVGLRICPGNPFNGLSDDDPRETFSALLEEINGASLAYLHVIRMDSTGIDNFELARNHFSGPLMFNDSFDLAEASAFIEQGRCDCVSFGRPFVANPDLVQRFKSGAALAKFNPKTLYTPGPAGYSDYPAAT